jgi:hypothetical protein
MYRWHPQETGRPSSESVCRNSLIIIDRNTASKSLIAFWAFADFSDPACDSSF